MPPKRIALKRSHSPTPDSNGSEDRLNKVTPSDASVSESGTPMAKKVSTGSIKPPSFCSKDLLGEMKLKTEKAIWESVVPFKRLTKPEDFDSHSMLKFITWNVAGLRAIVRKDATFLEKFLSREAPDILCLQETKLNVDDNLNKVLGNVSGYVFIDHPCEAKKGYSGVRTYLKVSSMIENYGARTFKGFMLPDVPAKVPLSDNEGRVLTTFFTIKDSPSSNTIPIALINTYVPNSGMTLDRLDFRTETFDQSMRSYLQTIDDYCKSKKSAPDNAQASNSSSVSGYIWTGDLNVAERDFDRYYAGNFASMSKCSGFTPEERASFRQTLLDAKGVDTFRMLYPNSGPVYTFWSARINGRARGMGWRLDYFVVSAALASRIVDCFTMPEILGSDHCPVQLWFRK